MLSNTDNRSGSGFIYRYLLIVAVTLQLAACSMPESNISGNGDPETDKLAHLLVDKAPDQQAGAMVFVENIDNLQLDLVNDPRVYLLTAGKHVLLFSAQDLRNKGKTLPHRLEVTTQAGKYYQVLPLRSNGELMFKFTEIDPERVNRVNQRENRALMQYLLRGE